MKELGLGRIRREINFAQGAELLREVCYLDSFLESCMWRWMVLTMFMREPLVAFSRNINHFHHKLNTDTVCLTHPAVQQIINYLSVSQNHFRASDLKTWQWVTVLFQVCNVLLICYFLAGVFISFGLCFFFLLVYAIAIAHQTKWPQTVQQKLAKHHGEGQEKRIYTKGIQFVTYSLCVCVYVYM